MRPASDIAFTPTVKALQARKGSRHAYARMEQGGGWESRITPDLKEEIEAQISVMLATANAEGQPYVQHRGGPAGFLHVLDEHTIAFADFAGNRQYITQGNLSENPRAFLFLMDYALQRRIKIWGRARVVEGDAELGPVNTTGAGRVVTRKPASKAQSGAGLHTRRAFATPRAGFLVATRREGPPPGATRRCTAGSHINASGALRLGWPLAEDLRGLLP